MLVCTSCLLCVRYFCTIFQLQVFFHKIILNLAKGPLCTFQCFITLVAIKTCYFHNRKSSEIMESFLRMVPHYASVIREGKKMTIEVSVFQTYLFVTKGQMIGTPGTFYKICVDFIEPISKVLMVHA
jgi:hypothetical protein